MPVDPSTTRIDSAKKKKNSCSGKLNRAGFRPINFKGKSGFAIESVIIIELHETTFCLMRGKSNGFSGLENKLFTAPNTRMLYGDAKATVAGHVT